MAKPKDPADRPHIWARDPRPDELPAAPPPAFVEQHVHKAGGVYRHVRTREEFEAALTEGYVTAADLHAGKLGP